MLGVLSDEDEQRSIEEWRQRQLASGLDPDVGRKRGTRVHARLESYIRSGGIGPPEADQEDAWGPPHQATLRVELGKVMAKLDDAKLLLEEADKVDCLKQLELLMDGQDLDPQDLQAIQDFLDACFFSGMEEHLDPYEEFLWSERPLRDGWEHCWSAPAGDPDRLARVWSTVWGFSGTPDLIARRSKGVNVLGDFKTAARPYFRCHGSAVPNHKKTGYKKYKKTVRQLCAYRIAIKETLGIDIHALQIIVGLPQPGKAQMFYVQGTELEIETENVKRAAVMFWSQYSGCTVPDPSLHPARC
jgi:hypothetical protein